MKRKLLIGGGIFIIIGILFRLLCGIFVVQPMGAVPEGVTIVYWRSGMNIPFVSSADGILQESERGVSLLGRAVVIGELAKPIKEREIVRFGYSEMLYLWSTNGNKYEK